MAYTKTVWKAEEGTLLNRFTKSNETTTSVELVRNPDAITIAGTAFNVSNMNNIEDAIENIINNTFTFEGLKTFDSKLTITGTTGELLSVGADSDITATIGRGKLGLASNGTTDVFYLAHTDHFTSTNYGIRFNANGRTNINSKTAVDIRFNDVAVSTFSGTAINMYKSTTITSLGSSLTIEDTTPLASGVGGSLLFRGVWKTDGSTASFGNIRCAKANATSGSLDTELRFATRSTAGGQAEHMFLTKGGELLIGTTTSDGVNKLQVDGSMWSRQGRSIAGSMSGDNIVNGDVFTYINARLSSLPATSGVVCSGSIIESGNIAVISYIYKNSSTQYILVSNWVGSGKTNWYMVSGNTTVYDSVTIAF